jgi:hypothetical protein
MTITLNIHQPRQIKSTYKLPHLNELSLSSLWWHLKAFGQILGILPLVLLSLLVLRIDWLYFKTRQLPAKQQVFVQTTPEVENLKSKC